MQTKALCLAVLFTATLPNFIFAQGTATDSPLSAIDWLDSIPKSQPIVLVPDEPNVTNGADVPDVSVTTLDGPAVKIIGLVPSNVSGLPRNLWSGSDAAELANVLANMPTLTLPAAQASLFTLLLAVADPSVGDTQKFDLARVDALLNAGALEPALALIEQIGPSRSPEIAKRYLDASLLHETEDAACDFINAKPFLAPDYTYRIFCAARAGDWNTAALLLGTARALGTVSPTQTAILEHFLDPGLFEGEPHLPRPAKPNALFFRMYEALGQPISTRSWPVIYANADLRDVVGWKTQIEAAERLAQTGALPANRLLGIYSERQPAASGGIWDRVAAVQRFETALNTGHKDAIIKTLPKAWRQMQSVGLGVPFATLFTQRLIESELPSQLHKDVFAILESGTEYEAATALYPATAARHPFRKAVAAGDVDPKLAVSLLEVAIARGFSPGAADATLLKTAKNGALGMALLRNLSALHAGTQGDMGQLSKSLGTLRALGLEDVARRAALQMLIAQDAK
jgi:hypothetical protein|tara:strand:- start:2434 stop:3978 length:1545 start_codon:yes stop_codon:yes gene_type:complete